MACPGFNLPAGIRYCPAMLECMRLATEANKEAICHRCYACSKRYKWHNVKKALEDRAKWWADTDPVSRGRILAQAVKLAGETRYFRCYDSGDVDLTAYDTWITFVEELPDVLVWLPSRTWIFADYLAMLRKLNEHPRIVVRPSSLCFDDPPPKIEGLSAGMASAYKEPIKADRDCPGQCGTCRLCWTEPESSVNFKRK